MELKTKLLVHQDQLITLPGEQWIAIQELIGKLKKENSTSIETIRIYKRLIKNINN